MDGLHKILSKVMEAGGYTRSRLARGNTVTKSSVISLINQGIKNIANFMLRRKRENFALHVYASTCSPADQKCTNAAKSLIFGTTLN